MKRINWKEIEKTKINYQVKWSNITKLELETAIKIIKDKKLCHRCWKRPLYTDKFCGTIDCFNSVGKDDHFDISLNAYVILRQIQYEKKIMRAKRAKEKK